MATFVTTDKMNPALAARVEASVRGRSLRRSPGARMSPTGRTLARLTAVIALVGIVAVVGYSWYRRDSEVERSRAALITDLVNTRKQVAPRDRGLVQRVEVLLTEANQAAAEDVVSDELKSSEAIAAELRKSAVYVRGRRTAFGDPSAMPEALHESVKDALLLCLLDPPSSMAEQHVLQRVFVAYSGQLEKRSPNVRRVQSAVEGLPLLSDAWLRRVEQASGAIEIGKLRTTFDRAPLERAIQAASAERLIYVFDEAPDDGAAVELDGACRHHVRVGMVDIWSGKPLFRLRRQVDPAWVSDNNRAQLARGLNGCRLAFEIRAHLAGDD